MGRGQHQLLGHWSRQQEGGDRGLAGRMLQWRCQKWWTAQQLLPVGVGKRHPRRFHACNVERSCAGTFGVDWMDACQNREGWKRLLALWLRDHDVPWTRGRQLSLQ